MAHPRADDSALVAEPSEGQAQFVAEVGKRLAADIAQLHVLEVAPEPFVRIQLRSVGRQGLQLQPGGGTLRKEVLHDLRAVNGRAIPDHQQLAGEMAQEMLEEAHHVRPTQRSLLYLHEDLAARCNGANGRQVIARERDVQQWRLAPGRIGADEGGQQVEAGFIDPDEGTRFLPRLLLEGQRALLLPRGDSPLVPLGGTPERLLDAEPEGAQQATDMGRVVAHAKLMSDEPGHPLGGPDRPEEAEGLRATGEQGRELSPLVSREAGRGAGGGAPAQGFDAPGASTVEPAADRSWGNAQRLGDGATGPAGLMERPSAQAPPLVQRGTG